MGVSASLYSVYMDKIVFDDYIDLKRYADEFKCHIKTDGFDYTDYESIIAMMASSIASETDSTSGSNSK